MVVLVIQVLNITIKTQTALGADVGGETDETRVHYALWQQEGLKLESLRRSWKKKEINMFVVKSAEINMFVRLKSVARSYKPTDEQSWWTWRSRRARYFPQNQKLCVSAVSKKKISAGLVTKFKVEKQENGANAAVGRGSWLADWFRGWDDCDKKRGGRQSNVYRADST